MVVLALIAVLMMSGLRFVLRSMASTDNRREAIEELTLGLSVLRGELERAEPLMVKVGKSDLVLFNGQADRLRFANVEPPYLGRATLPHLRICHRPRQWTATTGIELRRAALDPAAPDLAAVEAGEARTVLRVGRNCVSAISAAREARPARLAQGWPPARSSRKRSDSPQARTPPRRTCGTDARSKRPGIAVRRRPEHRRLQESRNGEPEGGAS